MANPDQASLDAAKTFVLGFDENKDCDLLQDIAALEKQHPDIVPAFAETLRSKDVANPIPLLAVLLALSLDETLPKKTRAKNAQTIAASLHATIRDPATPSNKKVHALSILEAIGHPFPEADVFTCIPDIEEAVAAETRTLHANSTDAPEEITASLEDRGLAEPEDQTLEAALDMADDATEMAKSNPAGALHLAAAIASLVHQNAPHKETQRYLDELRNLASPRARWSLERFAEWPMPQKFRTQAREGAAALAGDGIQTEQPKISFSRAYITIVDGIGTRMLLLLGAPGESAASVMLNDGIGVKDAACIPADQTEEFEEMMRGNPDIPYAEIPQQTAAAYLADALAKHAEQDTSPPATLFALLPFFGAAPITPKLHSPDLTAYDLTTSPDARELAAASEQFADSPLFASLQPDSDEAYRFCEKYKKGKKDTIPESAFNQFITEIASKEKDATLRRMALNLEQEALAGRAKDKTNTRAAQFLYALQTNAVPFEETPFARALARSAVANILSDLREGYNNREEALAAAEEFDMDAMTDMFQQMLPGFDADSPTAGDVLNHLSFADLQPPPSPHTDPKRNTPKDKPRKKR